ncbi:hypothetical protein MKZ38_001363 [Zalerion maritima]|uniref:Uncharacterized protein n=1 Tax=Zalerion maritima TaxID=339359 RepID=A0AAD5RXY7_9PEZI|nr:hypothetical protein MKZ38_001363 [Zalerion maritima]
MNGTTATTTGTKRAPSASPRGGVATRPEKRQKVTTGENEEAVAALAGKEQEEAGHKEGDGGDEEDREEEMENIHLSVGDEDVIATGRLSDPAFLDPRLR